MSGKGPGSITIEYDRYALVYAPDDRGGIEVVRCIPKEGQRLFEARWHYDKQHKPCTYYVLASDKADAAEELTYLLGSKPWSIRSIGQGEEAERILTDKYKMPL